MIDYTIQVLQKYAVFDGRARRAEYWYFFLASFLLTIVLSIISVMGTVVSMFGGNFVLSALLSNLSNIASLALFIPSIAVGVRRMHDVDRSGWFLLVPLYNLYLAVQPGTVGTNRFGPDPIGGGVPVPAPVAVPTPPPVE